MAELTVGLAKSHSCSVTDHSTDNEFVQLMMQK